MIRHADAGAALPIAAADRARHLSARGRRQAARLSLLLRAYAPTLVVTSPLPRAYETARRLVRAWPRTRLRRWAALTPGAPLHAPLRLLACQRARRCALVGHEPALAQLAAALLARPRILRFPKGDAALLRFPGRIRRGRGRLLWLGVTRARAAVLTARRRLHYNAGHAAP